MHTKSDEIVTRIARDWDVQEADVDEQSVEIYIALRVEKARAAWERGEDLAAALHAIDQGLAAIPRSGWPELEVELLIERAVLFNQYDYPRMTVTDLEAARRLAASTGDVDRAAEIPPHLDYIWGPNRSDPPPELRRTMMWESLIYEGPRDDANDPPVTSTTEES